MQSLFWSMLISIAMRDSFAMPNIGIWPKVGSVLDQHLQDSAHLSSHQVGYILVRSVSPIKNLIFFFFSCEHCKNSENHILLRRGSIKLSSTKSLHDMQIFSQQGHSVTLVRMCPANSMSHACPYRSRISLDNTARC